MILPQIAEKLTATDIQESSAPKYSASEEWVRGSGFSKAASKLNNSQGNNLCSKPQAQELYVQIKDKVAYQIIKHGLSKAESKLFFYFLLLDRFGDRPVKVKVAEILLETGISKSAYHLAISKFQTRGWFGFIHADVQISNFCTPTKRSKKQDAQSKKQDSQSKKQDFEELEPLPAKVSKTPQTLQTLFKLITHSLRRTEREF